MTADQAQPDSPNGAATDETVGIAKVHQGPRESGPTDRPHVV